MRPPLYRAPLRIAVATLAVVAVSPSAASADPAGIAATVPGYDHIAVIVEENHSFEEIIGNPNAPTLNRLAGTYGLATQYYGTSDPSAPNYVAMLGGSDFGIADNNPFYTHKIQAPSLMDQLDAAQKTWKGYFQSMPYAGYAQFCYPVRCNGTPDADPLYVAKHNGMPYFASIQDEPAKLRNMVPGSDLDRDLATGQLPNFAYIVPDQCHDMHGSPPWCEDSGEPGDVNDNRLVADADQYLAHTVAAITHSAQWSTGRNAIVITFDEGEDDAGCCGVPGAGHVATVVVTNNGPRGLADATPYSHYSLLATMEKAFGLGCLQRACDARNGAVMAPLFGGRAATTEPAPPRRAPVVAANPATRLTTAADPSVAGWSVVDSPVVGSQDNSLGAVAAGSPRDVWAVGNYQPDANPSVVQTYAVHYDGTTWKAAQTANVGTGLNSLFGVDALPEGKAWAVGESLGTDFKPDPLVEHFDGSRWSIVPSPSPSPGSNGAFFYGVTALSDTDVWAVGMDRDATGALHTLAEHYNGHGWTAVATPDPGSRGNVLYSVTAAGPRDVWAVGQRISDHSPDAALIEHFDGTRWSVVHAASVPGRTTVPFAADLSDGLQVVGSRESDAAPAATWAAHRSNGRWVDQPTDDVAGDENFLYGVSADWAVGTHVSGATGNNQTLIERLVNGRWDVVPAASPGAVDDGSPILGGVATISALEAWAVGTYNGPEVRHSLIMHYTG